MHTRVPDRPRRWYTRWWGISYLALLGLSAAWALCLAVLPESRSGVGPAKSEVLVVPVAVLDTLLAAGVVMGVARRRFWRVRSVELDVLISLVLFALAESAVVIFFGFACVGVSDR